MPSRKMERAGREGAVWRRRLGRSGAPRLSLVLAESKCPSPTKKTITPASCMRVFTCFYLIIKDQRTDGQMYSQLNLQSLLYSCLSVQVQIWIQEQILVLILMTIPLSTVPRKETRNIEIIVIECHFLIDKNNYSSSLVNLTRYCQEEENKKGTSCQSWFRGYWEARRE